MTYRASSAAGNGGTASVSSLTLTLPAGSQAGDAAIIGLVFNWNGASLSSVSRTGWATDGPIDAGSGNRCYILTKVLDAADITAGTVTLTFAAASRAVAAMSVFDTNANTAPFKTRTGGGTGTTTAPTVTTSQKNSDVVFLQSQVFAGAGQAPAVSFSGGITTDVNPRSNQASGANVGVTLGHIAAPTVGSYGGGTMTGASTATNYTSQAAAMEIQKNLLVPKLVVQRWNGTGWD
jgi:hypothetical protein